MAYEVPQKEFRKFLCRAAAAAEDSLPPYFPSVEEVDLLVDDPAFASSDSFKKDILFYFAASMIYGFYRDSQWHDENPGCREPLYPTMRNTFLSHVKGKAAWSRISGFGKKIPPSGKKRIDSPPSNIYRGFSLMVRFSIFRPRKEWRVK